MKKIFTLIAGVMIAASASATTPYKALYVVAEVSPAGAGIVYLDAKNDEDAAYVLDKSEDYGETAFIKIVGGENGGGDEGEADGFGGNRGTYEVKVYAEPEEGYEFVCLAGVQRDQEYAYADCFKPFTGSGQSDRVYDWNLYANVADGILININNVEHAQDGDSDGNPVNRDGILADPDTYFKAEPDTKVIVVYKEEGAEYPKLVEGTDGVLHVVMSADENAPVYNVVGQQVSGASKGIMIQNGRKYIVK